MGIPKFRNRFQWRIQDFPLGGGAPTSDAYTFQRKRMRKQKKWILLGGHTPAAPPGSVNGFVCK